MKRLMSGNEAIALGAWQAEVQYASAYPGTPSTEILEELAPYPGVKAEWASNEKVALDNAIGANFGGARTIAVMKHVGVNVAADALLSLSYIGVKAGLVLVSADDPGSFSSQNEQDNRQYARFGRMPCFDPADSEEARQYMSTAFEVSELFETPVIFRSTTRLSHSKSVVNAEDPTSREIKPFPEFDRSIGMTRILTPAVARVQHPVVEQRMLKVVAWVEKEAFTCGLNRIEWGDRDLGIVTTGIAYQYARELLPEKSILKLGMSYPLPIEKIREFAAEVSQLIVVEELDPFIEDQLKAAGIDVAHGKDVFPLCSEFTLAKVRKGLVDAGLLPDPSMELLTPVDEFDVVFRQPALCPGCPHRAFSYNLKRYHRKTVVYGDIGCYAMASLPPFQAMDATVAMGSSVGMAHGLAQASGEKVIGTIGDSTFFHSGLSPLASAVYNNANILLVVMDNRTTAMTGAQENPGTGVTLQGVKTTEIDVAAVARAMGVGFVEEAPAWDVKKVNTTLRAAMKHEDGPAVVVIRGACVFTPYFKKQPVMRVDPDKCVTCGTCYRVGCPAIIKSEEIYETSGKPKAMIDPLMCTGCTVCSQVCPVGAISPVQE